MRLVEQAEIKMAQITTAQLLASEAASFESALQEAGTDSETESITTAGVPFSDDEAHEERLPVAALEAVYEALGDSLQIRIHDDLHAKAYLTETTGLIGSSNLTRGRLEGNIELNGTLDDAGYHEVETLFEQTWEEADPFSERLAQLLEAPSIGRHLVALHILNREQLQRTYGIVNDGMLDAVEGRSLAGQVARLATQTPPPRFAADTPLSRYYTDLLTEAARRRGGDHAAAGFVQFRAQCQPNTHQLWKASRQSSAADSLPLDPTGDLCLLDWCLPTDGDLPSVTEAGN